MTTSQATGVGPRRRLRARRWATPAAIAAAIAAPWILDAYTISLASYALVLGLLASSAYVLSSVAGLPTLGQGAYLSVGGYLAGTISRDVTANGPVQLLAAAGGGALAAAAVGTLASRTRRTYFLMITLAVGALTQTIAGRAVAITGGDAGLLTHPTAILPGTAPITRDGYLYLYTLTCALMVGGGLAVLLRSRFGLALRAIADDEPRARADGYPVGVYLWTAYVIAGAVAGAAGALLVATRHAIAPIDGGFVVSALALLATVLTTRTQAGATVGAAVIVAARDLLAPAAFPGHADALLGVLFLAAAFGRRPTRRLVNHVVKRRTGGQP